MPCLFPFALDKATAWVDLGFFNTDGLGWASSFDPSELVC